MKIRNKKTYFSSLPEGQAPVNPAKSLTSGIYFFILFAIIAYLIVYSVNHLLYLEARGQVEVGRYLIHANLDGTIDKILITKDDTVESGQVLATILQPPRNQPSIAKDLLKTNRDISQKEADLQQLETSLHAIDNKNKATAPLPANIIKLDNDIRIKQAGLLNLEQQKYVSQVSMETNSIDQNQRLLELSRVDHSVAADALKTQQLIDIEIAASKQEIDSLKQYRKELLEAERQALALKIAAIKGDINLLQNYLVSLEQGGQDIAAIAEKLVSPINGQVQAIFKLAGEQTSAGDAVLALRAPEARVAIHGYFREEQLPHLQKNKKVKITFADNSHSVGIISNHYSIASSYREKLKNEYIPIQSAVLVEILPVDPAEDERWRNFDRLDVKIKVKR